MLWVFLLIMNVAAFMSTAFTSGPVWLLIINLTGVISCMFFIAKEIYR